MGTRQGHHLPQRGQWLGLRLRFSLTHSLKLTHSLYTHSDSHSGRGLNPATRGARAKRSPRNTRTRHAPGPGQRKPRTPPTDACRLQDSRVDRRRAQACGGSRAGASVRGSLSLRARRRGIGDAGGVEPAPPPRGTQRRTRAHRRMTTVSSTSSFCRRRRRRLLRGALGSPSAVKARGPGPRAGRWRWQMERRLGAAPSSDAPGAGRSGAARARTHDQKINTLNVRDNRFGSDRMILGGCGGPVGWHGADDE